MQTVTLNNGIQMPILGFGVFQVGPDETEAAVSAAIAAGYRLIDTASAYENEQAVGAAIAKSNVPRDELFITTKLWVQDSPSEKNTARAFDASLRRLGLDYIDLYLIHQPYGDYYGQWREMERIAKDGRARAIGVSNFSPDRLVDLILHNEIVPAVNQIETNPLYQRTADKQILDAEGVQLESWGPFSEGRVFESEILDKIGRKHGRSIAQVTLRWLVQQGIVAIPKSVSPHRMTENLNVFDFALDAADMARISEMDLAGAAGFDHTDTAMVRWLGNRRIAN